MLDRHGPGRGLLALFGVAFCASACTAGDGALQVTFLGNEGFLLRAGDKSVLVDAITGNSLSGYPPLPAEPRAKLEAAEPPFGQVDLVLATHAHADHLDPGAVGRYLKAAGRAQFVSTESAVGLVRKRADGDESLLGRLHGYNPKPGRRVELNPNGIPLQLFRLPHDAQSLGFIVEIGGKKVLHVGDSSADAKYFALYDLPAQKIDIAMIPFWIFQSEAGLSAVRDNIGAAQVIAMHVPDKTAPSQYFGKSFNLDRLYRDLQEAWPGIVLMKEPLETRDF